MPKKRPPLVSQYLERISRTAIRTYQPLIRRYTKGRDGIYALYKGDKLFYVGLATNLNNRLKQHLNKQGWDRFSVYLTIGDSHIKELESLLLRIADPKGNKVGGRLTRSQNLKVQLKADIKHLQSDELNKVIGYTGKPQAKRPSTENGKQGILAKYLARRTVLIGRYKGQTHKAIARSDGTIRYRGKVYSTPSMAAKAATHRPTFDGWWFWHYERAPGDWVRLKALRQ